MGNLENDVERYLRQRVENLDGKCLKWVCPQNNGVPDRIVLINSKVYFVELKRPIKSVWSHLQQLFARWLVKRNYDYSLIASKLEVDCFINRIKNELHTS